MSCFILIISAIFVWFMYKKYVHYMVHTVGEDDSCPTPAITKDDAVDYVPTDTYVLFGHHFASIAGAGPIVGPVLGAAFGVFPVWIWLLLGGVFFGAAHDYTAMFVSMKEGGKSVAQVAYKVFGRWGFGLFVGFTMCLLFLVCASFLKLAVNALTSFVKYSQLGIDTMSGEMAIGGIASTSIIVVSVAAPILGCLLRRIKLSKLVASSFAVCICVISVYIGANWPIIMSKNIWIYCMMGYVFLASMLPVWFLLQPRDFINVHLLYVGLGILFLSNLIVPFMGMNEFKTPMFDLDFGFAKLGHVWPVLFITVACGAVSGFHALVAGGTSSKQAISERAAKRVAAGSMLLETMFAILVLISISLGVSRSEYIQLVFPTSLALKSNPILAFVLASARIINKAVFVPQYIGVVIGLLMVSGFIVTTLDTAIRLNRYLLEELWIVIFHKGGPAILSNRFVSSAITCGVIWFIAYKQAYIAIWPIFGGGNQLLAALSMIVLSAWLAQAGKRIKFLILPCIFMCVTSVFALIYLLSTKYIPSHNMLLIVADSVLLVLVGILIIVVITKRKVIYRRG